jgi:hypothetical protein
MAQNLTALLETTLLSILENKENYTQSFSLTITILLPVFYCG